MVDCGMEQGADIYENCTLPLAPSQIDYVLLTHAHIDHSGKIPYLTAEGFHSKIYATAATVKLCSIMLLDSAHIQEQEAKWKNKKAGYNPECLSLFYNLVSAMFKQENQYLNYIIDKKDKK